MPTASQIKAAIKPYTAGSGLFSHSVNNTIQEQVNNYLQPFIDNNQPLPRDAAYQLTMFFRSAVIETLQKEDIYASQFYNCPNCLAWDRILRCFGLADQFSTTEFIVEQNKQGKLLSFKIALWLDRLNQSKLTPPYQGFTSKKIMQHVTSATLTWYESINMGSSSQLTQQRLNHLAEFPNSCTAEVLELLSTYLLNSDANINLVFEFESKGFMTKNLKIQLWGNKEFMQPEKFDPDFAANLWRKYVAIAQRNNNPHELEVQILEALELDQQPAEAILKQIQDSFIYPTLSTSFACF